MKKNNHRRWKLKVGKNKKAKQAAEVTCKQRRAKQSGAKLE